MTGSVLRPLPTSYAATRRELQRVATHVLARRQHQVTGRFGLRATPGGFGTPAFGPEHEVVRIAGTRIVRETIGGAARTTSLALEGSTLADAAAFAGVDLGLEFRVGDDTVPVGDPAAPLVVDGDAAGALADWYAFAWPVLDETVEGAGPSAEPSVVQLWPGHFDAAVDVGTAHGRVNLGASPGDSWSGGVPYLYVAPWDAVRPGAAASWDAPFGAALAYDTLRTSADPRGAAGAFFARRLELLA